MELFRQLIWRNLFLLIISIATLEGKLFDGKEFDFIIVGGGTAGLTLAGRLAESGRFTVLVIQERGVPNDYLNVPAISFQKTLAQDPCTDKVYNSVPQKFAALAWGGVITQLISMVLGGGSQHNEQFLNRGSPHDFDNWAAITRDVSWKYQSLLKYFKKFETYKGANPNRQRGFNGPIVVSRPNYAPDFPQWQMGGEELGFRFADPNAPQVESFSFVEFSKDHGRRVSSYKGYVFPKLETKQASLHNPLNPSSSSNFEQFNTPGHLTLLTFSVVKRVLLNGNRAIGVEYKSSENDAITAQVFARNEVIISAGVMDSPAILMRSGIGPADVLKEAKIPAVKILPVGIGLQDHPYIFMTVILGNRSSIYSASRDLTSEAWKIFEEDGDGPFTYSATGGGQAFLVSSVSSPFEKRLRWPDIHLFPISMDTTDPTDPQQSDLKPWETPVLWMASSGRPVSRGTLRLNTTHVEAMPIFDYQMLSHPHDREVMLEAVKIFVKLCEETSAYRSIGCRLPSTPFPACAQHKYPSDEYWNCLIIQTTVNAYHGCGTCRMGVGPEAVLTPELKVIGINGLRVVDASIMPAVTNANLQAPIYAIAEKAADMILKEWGALQDEEQFRMYPSEGISSYF